MDTVQLTDAIPPGPSGLSRRRMVLHIGTGAVSAALLANNPAAVAAQETTPTAGQCVATAPPLEDGIGFAQLLVGGIVHDMPPGPVEVRISRLAMAPGTTIEAAAAPYPALMYMETGTTACPGGPGKIMYGADGTVMYETTGEAASHVCPTGTTWYIPGGIEDAALNEGTELMSSLLIEFVPVEQGATPTA
jgi:hypothetical protein